MGSFSDGGHFQGHHYNTVLCAPYCHVKKCGLFFLITPTMQNFFDVYLKITFSNSRQPLKLLFEHYNFGDFEKFFEWKLGRYV